MSDAVEFTLFMLGCFSALALVIFLAAFAFFRVDVWQNERECNAFGEASGLEVRAELQQCFINDPHLGWVTYTERVKTRSARRGLQGFGQGVK